MSTCGEGENGRMKISKINSCTHDIHIIEMKNDLHRISLMHSTSSSSCSSTFPPFSSAAVWASSKLLSRNKRRQRVNISSENVCANVWEMQGIKSCEFPLSQAQRAAMSTLQRELKVSQHQLRDDQERKNRSLISFQCHQSSSHLNYALGGGLTLSVDKDWPKSLASFSHSEIEMPASRSRRSRLWRIIFNFIFHIFPHPSFPPPTNSSSCSLFPFSLSPHTHFKIVD